LGTAQDCKEALPGKKIASSESIAIEANGFNDAPQTRTKWREGPFWKAQEDQRSKITAVTHPRQNVG